MYRTHPSHLALRQSCPLLQRIFALSLGAGHGAGCVHPTAPSASCTGPGFAASPILRPLLP